MEGLGEDLKELTKELKVLVVEDEDTVREGMKNLFEVFFKEVDVAQNGIEAWEKIEKITMT